MDLKVKPRSYKGHKFILVAMGELANFIVTNPIYQRRWEKIDVLIEYMFSKYDIPESMIID